MGNNGIDKVNSSDDYLGISGRQQLCPKELVQLEYHTLNVLPFEINSLLRPY